MTHNSLSDCRSGGGAGGVGGGERGRLHYLHSALARYPRQRALICRAGDLHRIASSVGVGSRDAGKTSAPALCGCGEERVERGGFGGRYSQRCPFGFPARLRERGAKCHTQQYCELEGACRSVSISAACSA